MNTQATLDQLRQLKLHGMARSYEALPCPSINTPNHTPCWGSLPSMNTSINATNAPRPISG